MINIISRSYCSRLSSGPKKVVDNLIKGFKILNYPYVVNKRLDACQRLWIHDDLDALKQIRNLKSDIKVIAGPNIVVLPRYLPEGLNLSKAVYVQPSRWAAAFWKSFGYDRTYPVAVWPAGIDTDEFHPSSLNKELVLVYFKQRYREELDQVEKSLMNKQIKFKTLIYGSYKEKDYKFLLARTRYVIWLGRHDTQGIALQEALAANVPILVWDVKTVDHWSAAVQQKAVFTPKERGFDQATSAEYFDETCGIKIFSQPELSAGLTAMEQRWREFQPRKFILENLGLRKQAQDFLSLYREHFGLSPESGKEEDVTGMGNWKNNQLPFKLKTFMKDMAKIIFNSRA